MPSIQPGEQDTKYPTADKQVSFPSNNTNARFNLVGLQQSALVLLIDSIIFRLESINRAVMKIGVIFKNPSTVLLLYFIAPWSKHKLDIRTPTLMIDDFSRIATMYSVKDANQESFTMLRTLTTR